MDTKAYFEQLSDEDLQLQLDKWTEDHQHLEKTLNRAKDIRRRFHELGQTNHPEINDLESYVAGVHLEVEFILMDILGTRIRRNVGGRFEDEEPEDQTYEE